jgi:hypothetical protein
MEPSEQIPLIDVTAEPIPLKPPPAKTIYVSDWEAEKRLIQQGKL